MEDSREQRLLTLEEAEKIAEVGRQLQRQKLVAEFPVPKQKASDRIKKLSTKMELGLRYHVVLGKSIPEAAQMIGVSATGLGYARDSEPGKVFVEHLRGLIDEEFKNRAMKVLGVIDLALDHTDPKIALAGSALWLKHFKTQKLEVDLTAEDVVSKLMGVKKDE